MLQGLFFHTYGPHAYHFGSVLEDFPSQGFVVLFLLRFELEEPVPGLGEILQLFQIDGGPEAFARVFVVQHHGIVTVVMNLKPAVAESAGSENLDGVRQALPAF